MDGTVDVGKEADCEGCPDAFFIAKQEIFFERGQLTRVHCENNLVDNLLSQELRQVRYAAHRVLLTYSQHLRQIRWRVLRARFLERRLQEAEESHTILRRPFQHI